MLYDPAPLNDLGDPGHDMSAYMNYSGGGLSYSYRRSLRMAHDECMGRALRMLSGQTLWDEGG